MSLQDDFFDLDSTLKGEQKRKLRRIWGALCDAERAEADAEDCIRLVNGMRRMLADKPPLSLRKKV